MTPPPPAPSLPDELIKEIFLRLPPDEPENLFRPALVCKPWLRILCDPGFLRSYLAFHGAPPLLGACIAPDSRSVKLIADPSGPCASADARHRSCPLAHAMR